MTITTLDGVVAGMQPPVSLLKVGVTMKAAGTMTSYFYTTGSPGTAAAPSPGLNGSALTTYAGQIPWTNPGSGNSYLAAFSGAATTAGQLILCDRLWHNSGIGITTTTAQSITTPTFPARDKNGATNGDDIMVALEVSAATGGGAVSNTTLSYTNQSGTASQTATMASFPATATVGTFIPFQLAAGDTGVRAIASVTLGTTYTSGTIHLVAYRVLARLNFTAANLGDRVDAITGGFPRLYDNTVPFLVFLPSATTATTVSGTLTIAQG